MLGSILDAFKCPNDSAGDAMPTPRQRPTQRLNELFAMAPKSGEKFVPVLQQLASARGLKEPDFENQDFFDECAGIALASGDGPFEEVLEIAFKKAGLLRTNPFHCLLMLQYFAWAHFAPRKKRGRKTKRSGPDYRELLDQARAVVLTRTTKPNHISDLLASLKKRHPEKYGDMTDRHLRRLLREACDPKKNSMLAEIVGPLLVQSRQDHLRRGLEWTPKAQEQATRTSVTSILHFMGLSVLT